MGKGKSSIFWELRGSAGQYKYTTRADGEIINSMKGKKNPVYKDKEKQEERDLRIAGYGGCGKLTRSLLPTINTGFLELKKHNSPVNAFMKKNVKTLCTAEREKSSGDILLTYDFLVMKVAGGSLDEAEVTATVDLEAGTVRFQQEAVVIEGGLARDDDQYYACLFSAGNEGDEEENAFRSLRVKLRERHESGDTVVAIPARWNKLLLFVYVYATRADGKFSSPSTRLYPPPTAEEIALAEAREEWMNARLQLAIRKTTATPEELEAIAKAESGEKAAITKAEKAARKEGKSPHEVTMAGIAAAVARLKMES